MKQDKGNGNLTMIALAQGIRLPDRSFVGIVDGADAPLLQLDLPQGLKGQARVNVAIRQVSGKNLQAQTDIELRPFSLHPSKTAWTRAIVTSASKAAAWRTQVASSGGRCMAILPSYLSLPVAADIWSIAEVNDTVTVRLGLEDGFAAEPELAALMLAKNPKPKAVLQLGAVSPQIDEVVKSLGVPVLTSPDDCVASGFAKPLIFANNEMQFDLARNPKAAFLSVQRLLASWVFPVAAATLALAMWSTSILIELQDDKARLAAIRSKTDAMVRENFVPTGPILDVQTQVNQVLQNRSKTLTNAARKTNPLALFKSASQVIAQFEATLFTAAYGAESGLVVSMHLPDFAALDRLAAALEAAQIGVTIAESSSADTAGIQATLILQLKGSAQ